MHLDAGQPNQCGSGSTTLVFTLVYDFLSAQSQCGRMSFSVVDQHWFQCGSGSRSPLLSQCGCRSGSREPNQCGSMWIRILVLAGLKSHKKLNFHIWVQSKHPLAQRNFIGCRWSSAEQNWRKKDYELFQMFTAAVLPHCCQKRSNNRSEHRCLLKTV